MAISDWETSSSDPRLNTSNAITVSNGIGSDNWHLEVLELPFTTTDQDIQTMFTKYGDIEKIAMIYKYSNNSLNVYINFKTEFDLSSALSENGRKVGAGLISVLKYDNGIADKGKKRMRTEESNGGWGQTSSATTTSSSTTDGGWGAGPSTSTTDTSGGWGSSMTDSWGAGSGGSDSRGRGRGGGGRGRGCFNCGEDGHMSRECSKPRTGRGGGSGGTRTCYKCGEEGHMSRECPKGGGRGCFNCGEEGHMSRECSKPRAERGRGRGRGMGRQTDSFASDSWGTSDATGAAAPTPSTPAPASLDWD